MENVKPGIKTTEFWLNGLYVVVGAVVALLVGYGMLSAEEGQMWAALLVAVLPLAVAGYSVGKYSEGRSRVKADAAFVNAPPILVEKDGNK